MNRKNLIDRSIKDLEFFEGKRSETLYYYLDAGVPMFDVYLSDKGGKINRSGKSISCGISTVDEMQTKLMSLTKENEEKQKAQTKLF